MQEYIAMLIQQGSLGFPSFRESGPQTVEQALNFRRTRASVAAFLSGFDVQFVDSDHHLHSLDIDLRTRNLSRQSVEVTGQFGLRDLSGNWDDRYAGFVRYTLVGAEAGEELLGGTLNFPRVNGSGPRTLNEAVRFANGVQNTAAGLTGFMGRFSTADHHLLQLESDVASQSPGPSQLQVSGTYGLRDSSGNWDDDYDGLIRYAALGTSPTESGFGEIRTGRLDFPPQAGSGPREQTTAITFANPIGNCAAVLTGFLIGFDQNDHHFHRAIVEVEARKLSDTQVEVVGHFGLRDDSGEWDDAYRGSIRFAVISE
jgi:hypothetical protein